MMTPVERLYRHMKRLFKKEVARGGGHYVSGLYFQIINDNTRWQNQLRGRGGRKLTQAEVRKLVRRLCRDFGVDPWR